MKLRKHAPGCYRLTLSETRFGQIRREGIPAMPRWRAEIRKTETGELVRHAGYWRTLALAEEELRAMPAIDYA